MTSSSGLEVLDVGSGPGHQVCEIAQVIGANGEVKGVDSGESSVERARRRAAGLENVAFDLGTPTACRMAMRYSMSRCPARSSSTWMMCRRRWARCFVSSGRAGGWPFTAPPGVPCSGIPAIPNAWHIS